MTFPDLHVTFKVVQIYAVTDFVRSEISNLIQN